VDSADGAACTSTGGSFTSSDRAAGHAAQPRQWPGLGGGPVPALGSDASSLHGGSIHGGSIQGGSYHGGSPLSSGAASPSGGSFTLACPDDLQLRDALDAVGDARRAELLSGEASPPEDHDGAVLEGGFGEQQAWIAKRLRKLGWLHVDADCGNVRSHAAVINRDGLFARTARHDVVDFVADHLALQ
jgi:hypothetical protein